MGRSALPTTLVFCCPLPASLSAAEMNACLDATALSATPVAWAASVARLPQVMDALARSRPGRHATLEVPAEALQSRQSLRRLIAAAQAVAPGIDTALARGPLPQECRRMLVDAGIGVVLRDSLESVSRGARRPAPHGWPCRSVIWGLWEVTAADAAPPGMIGRILPWITADRPQPGGLVVVDLVGTKPSPASIRDRLERWQAWARWQGGGAVEMASLSDLPDLITGAARLPLSGSVLKAA